ncbi:MAG TPA: crosslink repair DNA glycosylase YcaQ family protein [Acidimicrobiia bacterium]|nr:crosslink repair DNA glycosylase YcaQ family protein [Acidimicrobiia bacterium]
MRRLTISQARRVALAAQGFALPRPQGKVDRRHLRKVLSHLGVVQIDSVNVVARAHYLPFFARLGNYPTSLLDEMAWGPRRELIEYWAHMAAFIPIGDWPLFRHRMEREHVWGSVARYLQTNPEGVNEILEQIRRHGPLRPADLEDHHETGRGPWWDWSFAKTALEWLFFKGEVTVPKRVNFVRYYDLPARVLPESILNVELSEAEQRKELLRRALRHCGVGTLADLTDYYRQLKAPTLPLLKELVAAGEAEEVQVEGWKEKAYLDPSVGIPRRLEGVALLCPFDPVVWFRPRTERLFGFHYRIEIYTPPPKRTYGYYVFPILLDGELVGRIDLKADRQAGALLVRASHVEAEHDPRRVAGPVLAELETMAAWLGLEEVRVDDKGNLASALLSSVLARKGDAMASPLRAKTR